MKKAALLLSFAFCMSAVADDFEAKVCHLHAGGYGVRINGESVCLGVIFNNSAAKDDFANLRPDDGLSFSGKKYENYWIQFESISSVSLQRLLGKWKDTKNIYYNFTDQSNVVVFDPASVKSESFYYELYPNSAMRWGMSMINSKSNRVGLLRQVLGTRNVHFEICLYQENIPAPSRLCSTLTSITN